MKQALALVFSLVFITSCSDFPDLGGAVSERGKTAPPPRLAPIDGLIIAAIGPARPGEPQNPTEALAAAADPLAARIAALRARAAVLRGRPVNDATRSELGGS